MLTLLVFSSCGKHYYRPQGFPGILGKVNQTRYVYESGEGNNPIVSGQMDEKRYILVGRLHISGMATSVHNK